MVIFLCICFNFDGIAFTAVTVVLIRVLMPVYVMSWFWIDRDVMDSFAVRVSGIVWPTFEYV